MEEIVGTRKNWRLSCGNVFAYTWSGGGGVGKPTVCTLANCKKLNDPYIRSAR